MTSSSSCPAISRYKRHCLPAEIIAHAVWLYLSVYLRQDYRSDPMDQQFLASKITVIAFVGKEQPRFTDRSRQQIRNGVIIRSLSAFQDEAKRASLTVRAGVDFRRKAAGRACPYNSNEQVDLFEFRHIDDAEVGYPDFRYDNQSQ